MAWIRLKPGHQHPAPFQGEGDFRRISLSDFFGALRDGRVMPDDTSDKRCGDEMDQAVQNRYNPGTPISVPSPAPPHFQFSKHPILHLAHPLQLPRSLLLPPNRLFIRHHKLNKLPPRPGPPLHPSLQHNALDLRIPLLINIILQPLGIPRPASSRRF